MADFSEGLLSGFSVMETLRDRKEARANDARRISLAEAANARSNDIFRINEEERARGHADQDRARRAAAARARVLRDPDNAHEDDLLILEEAGDSATLATLDDYTDKRQFATASLGDLANQASASPQPGGSVTPSRAPGRFTPAENQFLSPTTDSVAEPNQFPQPRAMAIEEVMDWMDPADPAFRATRARGADLTTPEGRAAARATGKRIGTIVQVPEGVLSSSEIDELPLVEQEAARTRNRELLGSRQRTVEQMSPSPGFGSGPIPAKQALANEYAGMLDSREDSQLRQLAVQQPTAWIERYRRDRNSLEPNQRALVDRRVHEIALQSLANIREQSAQIPQGADGLPDFSSPAAQAVKKGIEQNIAVLSQAEAGFSAADAAGIRGGFMPTGNRQLTERVTAAWQEQPTPAKPATETEERLFRTDMNRLAAADGARKISSATVNRLGKAVARGWVEYKDAESILLTGRVSQSAMQFNTASPTNDVYINGRLVRRGFDAAAAQKAADEMQEDQLKLIQQQFALLYPDDPEEQGRRMGQFMTQQYQQRDAIRERHGFDPLAASPQQTAAMINAFAATDKADNAWDQSWLGVRRWMSGPLEEQAPAYSNEIMQLTRDLLPDDYGVYNLGDRQFDANRARRLFMASGDPKDRAAVIATEGDDAALMQYVEQKIAEQQGQ